MIEAIKIQVDILKVKLAFFSALMSGTIYLFLRFHYLEKFFNTYLLFFCFILILLYGIVGALTNLFELSKKYKELQNEL